MAGRTGEFKNGRYEGMVYLETTKDNDFQPNIPDEPVDLIYLCSPTNPTGSTMSNEQLNKKWTHDGGSITVTT